MTADEIMAELIEEARQQLAESTYGRAARDITFKHGHVLTARIAVQVSRKDVHNRSYARRNLLTLWDVNMKRVSAKYIKFILDKQV
jgi:hypothetical protein